MFLIYDTISFAYSLTNLNNFPLKTQKPEGPAHKSPTVVKNNKEKLQ